MANGPENKIVRKCVFVVHPVVKNSSLLQIVSNIQEEHWDVKHNITAKGFESVPVPGPGPGPVPVPVPGPTQIRTFTAPAGATTQGQHTFL